MGKTELRNLRNASFAGQNLDGADFSHADLHNADFRGCSLRGASFRHANLYSADLRSTDLQGVDFRDANLTHASLDRARLEDVLQNEGTQGLRSCLPEEGALLGFKKAYNHNLVVLLIPADARRSNGTTRACRCDKAKVLAIYDREKRPQCEAESLASEGFMYRVGEWVYAHHFAEDRFSESSGGIHFWLTREEAHAYT